jgi:protein TonB
MEIRLPKDLPEGGSSAPAVTAILREPISQPDFVRWSTCAVIAVALHGLVAFAIRARSLEVEVAGAGEPSAIVVELASLPVALPAPPNELAPGSLQAAAEAQGAIKENKQTDERTVEIDNRPQEAEALDRGDLKPEQSPESKVAQVAIEQTVIPSAPPSADNPADHSAAPDVGRSNDKASLPVTNWQRLLLTHLERHKRYPPQAHGDKGAAELSFTLDRQGRILNSKIIKSSGSVILDQEALALLRRAQPLPTPPAEASSVQLSFVMPIRYGR